MNLVNGNPLAIVPYTDRAARPSPLYMQECLRARMQSLIENSFKAHFQDFRHFHRYWMGDIVVLVGTSTAGKTSIIRALKQLEPDRLEDGGDLRFLKIDLENLQGYAPNEFKILEQALQTPLDIPKSLFSKERAWKAEISSQEKIEAEEAIQRIKKTRASFSLKEQERERASFQHLESAMIDDAFDHSRRGSTSIFDVLTIDVLAQQLLMRKFNGPIRVILIYCPFHALASRMKKRNKEAEESGELSNQRIGEFPLRQFSEIYTQKEEGQQTFERIAREPATQAFDENFDEGMEAERLEEYPMPSNEQIALNKKKRRAVFLRNLGFRKGINVVEVAPRNPHFYYLVLNSSQLLPTESAHRIHQGTYKRQQKH